MSTVNDFLKNRNNVGLDVRTTPDLQELDKQVSSGHKRLPFLHPSFSGSLSCLLVGLPSPLPPPAEPEQWGSAMETARGKPWLFWESWFPRQERMLCTTGTVAPDPRDGSWTGPAGLPNISSNATWFFLTWFTFIRLGLKVIFFFFFLRSHVSQRDGKTTLVHLHVHVNGLSCGDHMHTHNPPVCLVFISHCLHRRPHTLTLRSPLPVVHLGLRELEISELLEAGLETEHFILDWVLLLFHITLCVHIFIRVSVFVCTQKCSHLRLFKLKSEAKTFADDEQRV